jgi:hypothetical protein
MQCSQAQANLHKQEGQQEAEEGRGSSSQMMSLLLSPHVRQGALLLQAMQRLQSCCSGSSLRQVCRVSRNSHLVPLLRFLQQTWVLGKGQMPGLVPWPLHAASQRQIRARLRGELA